MTKPCPQCNQLNPPDAAFCRGCASPLQPSAPFIGQQQAQQWPGANVGGPIAGTNPTGAQPSQKGLVAMILAIVAILCCGPFTGVPAAILGWMELDGIKSGRTSPDSKVMAMIGLWGGIAASVIHAGFYILWILLSMMSAAANPYYY
ncbi:MAG TPA: zinc ribbon domain-containing protein [Pyrinomonadaceae bacterium]|nr:zinc ribbon domain-containing protein [Pyrinomonadaceae bacterium]HMP65294.1 zinc ribbon domain-containing protein [Pyrinomonadaceae bacterium]